MTHSIIIDMVIIIFSQSQAPPPKKSEAEIKEEEELQLALALSQSEAEEKEKLKLKTTTQILSGTSNSNNSTIIKAPSGSSVTAPEDLDPELVRYLDRNYWEQKEKEKAKAKTITVPPEVKKSNITIESSPTKTGMIMYGFNICNKNICI